MADFNVITFFPERKGEKLLTSFSEHISHRTGGDLNGNNLMTFMLHERLCESYHYKVK